MRTCDPPSGCEAFINATCGINDRRTEDAPWSANEVTTVNTLKFTFIVKKMLVCSNKKKGGKPFV